MTVNKRTKKIIFILIAMIIVAIGCVAFVNKKNKTNMYKKYEYQAGPVAPRMYPVEMGLSYLEYEKNKEWNSGLFLADGTTAYQGIDVDGGGMYPGTYGIPVGIDALWLSYAERKIYKLDTLFDREHIRMLFEQGYTNYDDNKGELYKAYFNQVDIGFIPGGRVLLYLAGFGGYRKLVAIYQGKEIKPGVDKFISGYNHVDCSTDSSYRKDVNRIADRWYSFDDEDTKKQVATLSKHGIPYELWDKYFERFSYSRIIEFENKDTVWKAEPTFFTRCFNGEEFNDTYTFIYPAARPWRITCGWDDPKGDRYGAYCFFEEEEVMRIFDTAYGKDKSQRGSMVFTVSKDNKRVAISLRVGEKSYPFTKVKMSISDNDNKIIYQDNPRSWSQNPFTYIGM